MPRVYRSPGGGHEIARARPHPGVCELLPPPLLTYVVGSAAAAVESVSFVGAGAVSEMIPTSAAISEMPASSMVLKKSCTVSILVIVPARPGRVVKRSRAGQQVAQGA